MVWAIITALVLGLSAASISLQRRHIGAQFHIHEHRHGAVLHDRVDGRGKPGRHGDDFVAGLDAPVLELGRGERGERDEVGRGAGVDQQHVLQAEEFGQARLELLGIAARRQPEVERGIHQVHQLLLIEVAARHSARGPRPGGRAAAASAA